MLRTALVHTAPAGDEAELVIGLAEGLPALGVSRVVLTSVVEASGMEGPVIAAATDRVLDALAEARPRLESAGLHVELRAPAGDPAHELIALAAEERIDLIVSGSHGKSQIDRLFSGSVSETLAAHTAAPSLVVRFGLMGAGDRPAETVRAFPRKVVVPTDFSRPAERAVEAALSLPADHVGEIVFLHIDDPSAAARPEGDHDGEVAARLESLVGRARSLSLQASYAMRTGAVAVEVEVEAAEAGATGIVVGTRGHSVLGDMLLGSVSLTLLREAPVPVMVVP